MDLRQLETFVRVAESGRCVAAARSLEVSPATISARLDRLEHAVGCRLLRRTSRHVGLTPAGASLLPDVRSLVEAAERLRARAEQVRQQREGVLRVATLADRRGTAVRVAGLLRRALPGWEVRIAVVGRRAMLDVFRDELADVALGTVRAPRERVRSLGIGGGRPGRRGETIAWRHASGELPATAIAAVAERVAKISRRRCSPGPTPESRALAWFFALVDRLVTGDHERREGPAGGGASRRRCGSDDGGAP